MDDPQPPAVPANLPLGVTAVMLPELSFAEQLALCGRLGVTHYVYRPRVIPDDQRDRPFSNWGNHAFDLTPQRLLNEGAELAERVKAAGLIPFGTVHQLNLDSSDEEIALACRGTLAAGASRMRLSPAPVPSDVLFDWPKLKDRLQGRFRDALAIADSVQQDFPAAATLKFTSEIHARQPTPTAGLARHVLEPFDPGRVGAILDLPNLTREGLTMPAVSISVLGPYVDHCHVGGGRRASRAADERGFTGSDAAFTSLRESDLHIPTWLRLIAEHADALGRDIPLVCEDYSPGMTGVERLTRTVGEVRDCFAD
ncbi:MAG: hypothetical protein AAGE65_07235 [Planctomycetota bacterium]